MARLINIPVIRLIDILPASGTVVTLEVLIMILRIQEFPVSPMKSTSTLPTTANAIPSGPLNVANAPTPSALPRAPDPARTTDAAAPGAMLKI